MIYPNFWLYLVFRNSQKLPKRIHSDKAIAHSRRVALRKSTLKQKIKAREP